MINKFEGIGILASISLMALALFFLNVETNNVFAPVTEEASQAAVVVAGEGAEQTVGEALRNSVDEQGDVTNLIIDDVVLGEGGPVVIGDTVSVHYIGTLQNGQEFDNSYKKGRSFSFTIGEESVIAGWEKGLLGMKAGGQRILVIPPELAYGQKGYGPIPGNATLVFAIELLEIN